jgi:hypothetical protein
MEDRNCRGGLAWRENDWAQVDTEAELHWKDTSEALQQAAERGMMTIQAAMEEIPEILTRWEWFSRRQAESRQTLIDKWKAYRNKSKEVDS